MSTPVTQHLKQCNVVLTDLDGLLVNSENFNQVFIQRIDPEWITTTINRVVKSELHLQKLIQVLTKFIVSECHPEWSHHALAWLTHLFRSPSFPRFTPALSKACRPLLSYATEMAGIGDLYSKAAMRGLAAEQWSKTPASLSGIPKKLYYGGLFDVPSTDYVYVDDSDEEFGQRQTKLRTRKLANGPHHASSSQFVDPLPGGGDHLDEGDLELDNSVSDYVDGDDDGDDDDVEEEDDGDDIDDQDLEAAFESDHGVFDVNETASSEELSAHDPQFQVVDEDPFQRTTTRPDVPSILFPDDTSYKHREADALQNSDEAPLDDDEEDSSESDEELDMLMWTQQHEDSSSNGSPSADEFSDLEPPSKSRSRKLATTKPPSRSPKTPRPPSETTRSRPLRQKSDCPQDSSSTPDQLSRPRRKRPRQSF
ncbi:Eukaryotictranslation initiation factor 3 subunit [Paragonimus heterotremus]|uniref:Eukaryotictranslation initiation factor 3 subunit n=1 Tax=Paragonimus heterotremus TaxID=100268 RepID=A0A8J4WGG2_9TREM|nr:Eukaryotictranslation initiation factor 3 subunit [Paragonimus heterotremus]